MIDEARYIRGKMNARSPFEVDCEVYSRIPAGQLYIHNTLQEDERMSTLGEFLKNSIDELIHMSYGIIYHTYSNPYIYNKTQFRQVMIAILAKMAERFITITTKGDESALHIKGHKELTPVNYICHYKDCNYYMEINKRSISYTTGKLCQEAKAEWENACEKLRDIKKMLGTEEAQKAVGVTIEVLNIYVSEEQNGNLEYDIEVLKHMKQKIEEDISTKYATNCSCLWVMNENVIRPYEYIHGREIYPAVLFLVNTQ